MRRLRFAAFFVRHSRAYLAAHWTVTVALAAVLFSAHQSTPVTGSGTQAQPVMDQITCPLTETLIHFVSPRGQTPVQFSGTSDVSCVKIVIVWSGSR